MSLVGDSDSPVLLPVFPSPLFLFLFWVVPQSTKKKVCLLFFLSALFLSRCVVPWRHRALSLSLSL